jgi:monofunctional biosynthetic peptidoglycan transglycosylase
VSRRRRPLGRRLTRLALGVALGLVFVSALAVALLRFVDPPTSAFMLERRFAAWREGTPFTLHHHAVPLSAISPNLQLAVVAAEDQKFASHFGFDVQAIGEAVEEHLEGRSSRGASTLTQQVAKNLFLWPGHSLVRKGLEAYFTVLLEALWPKRRILEVHLNLAEWGPGIFGAEAASRAWFKKSAASLSPEEAAALAAMLPAPRSRNPLAPSAAVRARMEWIQEQAARIKPDW